MNKYLKNKFKREFKSWVKKSAVIASHELAGDLNNQIEKVHKVELPKDRKELDAIVAELVHRRGTLQEFEEILDLLRVNKKKNVSFSPFAELDPELDFGFDVNIGVLHDTYLDYEFFMLKTRVKGEYFITEINPF